MTIDWKKHQADRVRNVQPSAIREILKVTQQPEVISFAGGLPAPELFPVDEINAAIACLMASDQAQVALQYHPTEGYIHLRAWLAERMTARGVNCSLQNILITSGSQQSLDLIGKAILDPGDRVIIEAPTYLGMLQAWTVYGAEFVSVETDDEGMLPDAFEAALQAGAKLIYMVPNFQNPSGVTTSADRRTAIVRLAEKYGVPIVEDDPYGRLRYEGEAIPALQAFDMQEHHSADLEQSNVLFLGTLSKELCPGFRLAWIAAAPEVIRLLTRIKQGADLHTSTFGQMAVYEVVKDGFADEHIKRLIDVYKDRRDLMLDLMAEYFPEGITWTHPEGGLFIWVRLPESVDASELFDTCIKNNVAFVPGQPFFADGSGKNTFRLNFSNAQAEQIQEGILRLSNALREYLGMAVP